MPNLIARLGWDGSAFNRGVEMAKAKASNFASHVAKSTKGMFIGAFGLTALEEGVRKAVELADELADMSAKTGLGTTFLQEMGYAAQMSGAHLGDVTKAVQKMQLSMMKAAGGDKGITARFERLGITLADIKSLKPEEVFKKMSEHIKGIPYSAQLTEDMMKTMGKSSLTLLPLMRDGLGELSDEAHFLGRVMSEETIAELKNFGDQIKSLSGVIVGSLGTAFAWVLKTARHTFQMMSYYIGEPFRVLGAMSGGASFKEALKVSQQVKDEMLADAVKGDMSIMQKAQNLKEQPYKTINQLGITEKVKDMHPVLLNVDSISKIGGFGGGQDRLMQLQRVNERIANSTENIEDKLDEIASGGF